ncbi:hypothetical protein PF008_g30818, partial [Phytophthora fragariae]
MLVMLLTLSPLPLCSPCRCGRAHRNAARRLPVPPPCPPCCARCHRYRYARRAAVAGPTGTLPDGRPCRRHARHAALAVTATAMLAVPLWPGSPECCPTVARAAAMRTIAPCCCRCAGRRHARHAAPAVTATATATLAVKLWPGSPECCLTVARAAAMRTIAPCYCCCAGRRHARHAALAVTVAAMLVMLLSLSPLTLRSPVPLWPGSPECCPTVPRAAAMLTTTPCCCRCAGPRHTRRAALAVTATATLAVPLWPGSPECCPTVARAAAMRTILPCCCHCAGRRHARHAALAVPA